LQADAAELVGTAPDVLFAAPTPALAALHHQTRSVPIVFVQVRLPLIFSVYITASVPY
jgi:putative ABC transport system substrate-binding protein